MPLLLILYPKESPEILTSISLAVVFFNALSGSEAYGLMKRIDYRSGLMFAAATVPGAVVGAMNTSHVPSYLFDIIFSVLMVAAAVFLLFRPGAPKATSKQSSHSRYRITRHLIDAHGHQYDYSFNPLLGYRTEYLCWICFKLLGDWRGDHPCSGSGLFLALPGSCGYGYFPFCSCHHGAHRYGRSIFSRGPSPMGCTEPLPWQSALLWARNWGPFFTKNSWHVDHSQPCSRLRASGYPHPHDCLVVGPASTDCS